MTKCLNDPPHEEPTVDVIAGALASPRRVAIVDRLCRAPATTSELAAHTGASLPTMLQHLERLRLAGLITSHKHGRSVTHTADLAPLTELEHWVETRRASWTSQLDSLAIALEQDLGR